MSSSDLRAGAAAVAPMLLGVIPFGLVAGATPVTGGLGTGAAVGLSTIVFAGASQLAVAEILAQGGSVVVAVMAACTINLRMVLYSASMAPFVSTEPLGRRMAAAYLLTDQAYAVSINRWAEVPDRERRLPYYFGAGLFLWVVWQITTVVGALVGAALPAEVPLDFAVPLVFLVLLVPSITSRPAATAAIAGGVAAVVSAEAGAGPLAIMIGAVVGIAAGALAEARAEGRAMS